MDEAIDRLRGTRVTTGSPAELACDFVLTRVRALSGALFLQGPRRPPLACASKAPALRRMAEHRFHRVTTAVARALVAWGDGFPVELLASVPSPLRVLELQARGARCVSLLADGVCAAPHADALAFALHDLCHLDKFADPEHHLGQVGFFASLYRLVNRNEWAAFEGDFDDAFGRDWHHVAADMNGSSVFLFAALKMKLKMAVRRRVASAKGALPPVLGPLTGEESRAFDERLDELLRLLDLTHDIADAARATSTRRDDVASALRLLRHFECIGRSVYCERPDADPRLD